MRGASAGQSTPGHRFLLRWHGDVDRVRVPAVARPARRVRDRIQTAGLSGRRAEGFRVTTRQPPDRGSLAAPAAVAGGDDQMVRPETKKPGPGWHAIWSARLASGIVDYCRNSLAPAAVGRDSEGTGQLRAFSGG